MCRGLQLQLLLYRVLNLVAVGIATSFWMDLGLFPGRSIFQFKCARPNICAKLFPARIRKVLKIDSRLKWIWVIIMMLVHLLMIVFETASIMGSKEAIKKAMPETNKCILVPFMIFQIILIVN